MLVKLDTARAAGLAQGVEHAARVDCVIAGHLERRVQRGGERRLELARLADAQLPGLQAQRVAQRELALQLACLISVAGDEQRARLRQPDVYPRGRLELGGELGPHLRGAQPEGEPSARVLAELDLGDGGEHASGDVRGCAAGHLPLEHGDGHSALARAPGRCQTDDARADDYDVG